MKSVPFFLVALLLVGCAKTPTPVVTTSFLDLHKGSDFDGDIAYGATGRLKGIGEKQLQFWQPTGFQEGGEEKIVFESVTLNAPEVSLAAVKSWRWLGLSEVNDSKPTLALKLVKESVAQDSGQGKSEAWKSSAQGSQLNFWTTSLDRNRVTSKAAIIVEGPEEDQQFISSALYHLTQETKRTAFPIAKFGMAPFGLSNDLYFGHTFWDMDIWMMPAIQLFEPQVVRDMVQYRLDRVKQAKKNFAIFSGKPNASEAVMFPWESSVSGKETVPGPSSKEHHITGSVVWGMTQAEALGLVPKTTIQTVAEGARKFYEARSVTGPSGREIKDVMSPDENHIGDNDLYTNLLAQWLSNGRSWSERVKFKLPTDSESFLTYDNDALRGYKQAAAVLAIYPLQYPAAEKQARKMMERFETKVSKNGPAMSDAIHATVWARLGESDLAYDAWKRAWEPFTTGRFGHFSEKRGKDRTYFYTGAAGALNSVIYGFAGFRLDRLPLPDAKWKQQLKSGWWISIKPCLPQEWKSVTLDNVILDGSAKTFVIKPNSVEVKPVS